MNTQNPSDLDKIINDIEPEHIPIEFVSAARVTTRDGQRMLISPEELEQIMDEDADVDPEDSRIAEIKLLIDMEAVRRTIKELAEHILEDRTV